MKYIAVVLLLSGCASFSNDSDCVALLKQSARAGCDIQSVVRDDYSDKCEVACK